MAARSHVLRRECRRVQHAGNPRPPFLLLTTSVYTLVYISVLLSCTCSSAEALCVSWFGSLGPDSGSTNDHCTGDHCPDVAVSHEGQGGFVPPTEGGAFHTEGNLEGDLVASDEDEQPQFELISTKQETGMLSSIGNSVTGAFSSAKKFVSRNVYKKAANLTQDFAEKVREVVQDELYGFVEASAKRIWNLLLSPDTLLGFVLQTYGSYALSISLIVLVLIMDYILLQFFRFLHVLTLDCTVLILHRIFGPQWIYSKLFVLLKYSSSFLGFVVRYPYLTAALVVVLFVLSIVAPIMRWTTRRKEKDKIKTIEECVVRTVNEVSKLGKSVEEMNQRFQRMEEKQEAILRLLREISHRT